MGTHTQPNRAKSAGDLGTTAHTSAKSQKKCFFPAPAKKIARRRSSEPQVIHSSVHKLWITPVGVSPPSQECGRTSPHHTLRRTRQPWPDSCSRCGGISPGTSHHLRPGRSVQPSGAFSSRSLLSPFVGSPCLLTQAYHRPLTDASREGQRVSPLPSSVLLTMRLPTSRKPQCQALPRCEAGGALRSLRCSSRGRCALAPPGEP